MKKTISYVIAALFFLFPLVSCADETVKQTDDKLNIVAVIFPQYDWVRSITAGNEDNVETTLLIDNGIDLHNYQPSTEDIVKILACDILIYSGGESDAWIDDLLKSSQNKDMTVINMLDILGDTAKTEEIKEGMESEDDSRVDDCEEEYDEHVWLSLRNAMTLCSRIADEISKKDPEFKELYRENVTKYNNELANLDESYREAVSSAKSDALLFADRFPFRYLTDDYGIEYYAAFPGCSAETEASFETIAYLSDKASELELKHIMIVDDSDDSMAKTIIQNSTSDDIDVLSLNSMQSVNANDIESGATYLSIMKTNLDVLKKALNAE